MSRNGAVTAYDAALILKYIVGDALGLASRTGFWDFYCAERCYSPEVSITTADFVGLLNGDVSGSWEPSGLRSTPSGLPIMVAESFAQVGDRLWKVTLGVSAAQGYLSGDYKLQVNPADWELVEVRTTSLTADFLVEGHLTAGVLRLAMAGAQPVSDGEVVQITLRSSSEVIGSVPELIWAEINDGSRPVELHEPTAVPPSQAEHLSAGEFRIEPNPFHGQVRMSFRMDQAGDMTLEVYAPDGRLVRRVAEGGRSAGTYTIGWDGRNDAGQTIPSGIYFARLRRAQATEVHRVILIE